MYHRIVGVSRKWTQGKSTLHPKIEGVMHEQIHQQWTDHPALRRSFRSGFEVPFHILERSFQPALNIEKSPLFAYVLSDCLQQQFMIEVVERTFDVKLDNPVIFPAAFARVTVLP
jgi:hypothetical protein